MAPPSGLAGGLCESRHLQKHESFSVEKDVDVIPPPKFAEFRKGHQNVCGADK